MAAHTQGSCKKIGVAAAGDGVRQSYKQMVAVVLADTPAMEHETVVAVADTQTMNEQMKTACCSQMKDKQMTVAGAHNQMVAAGVDNQMMGKQIEVVADTQMRGK